MKATATAELIVALDVPGIDAVGSVLDTLPAEVTTYKVGLELFASVGPAVLDLLAERDKRVFLDLKLHDIPNTVAGAIRSAAAHNVFMMTVHAQGGRAMLNAAADAARQTDANPKLVAVTTLTSLDHADLKDLGVSRSLTEHTLALGQLAVDAGIDGLVCSALETAAFRKAIGSEPLLVTPGIRPTGSVEGDQRRVVTPSDAVKAGSSYLVIGRPITAAAEPMEAIAAIEQELAGCARGITEKLP